MEVTKVLIWPTSHSKIAANGSLTLNDSLQIKFVVFKGSEGHFVGFPGKYGDKVDPETNKKIWYADVNFTNKALKDSISATIIKAYQDKVSGSSLNQGEAAGPSDQSIPF